MRKIFLRVGSLAAMAAVVLGAFGAHTLKPMLPVEQLDTFETGVQYHFYHALAILLVDVLLHFRKTHLLINAGWLFVAGIACFSGSLYVLTFREFIPFSVSRLAMLTPVGGLLFIVGWGVLFWSSFGSKTKMKRTEPNAAE
jgi:uncharacterized membrane protein YgdD (TMEM256/DUF423 family)